MYMFDLFHCFLLQQNNNNSFSQLYNLCLAKTGPIGKHVALQGTKKTPPYRDFMSYRDYFQPEFSLQGLLISYRDYHFPIGINMKSLQGALQGLFYPIGSEIPYRTILSLPISPNGPSGSEWGPYRDNFSLQGHFFPIGTFFR